jgi:hypothetical protein
VAQLKRRRERKEKELELKKKNGNGEANQHSDHLGKGLVSLYTVLNNQMVNKLYNRRSFVKSNSVALTKK